MIRKIVLPGIEHDAKVHDAKVIAVDVVDETRPLASPAP